MIKEILAAARVEHRRGRFPSAQAGTYAVYTDDIETDGADMTEDYTAAGWPRIYHHNVTVDLYESQPDDAAEAAIEAELDARGLPWSKEDRYWLQDVQRYQVIYEFSYTNKSR